MAFTELLRGTSGASWPQPFCGAPGAEGVCEKRQESRRTEEDVGPGRFRPGSCEGRPSDEPRRDDRGDVEEGRLVFTKGRHAGGYALQRDSARVDEW